MQGIKKIDAYKTSDSRTFESLDAAQHHMKFMVMASKFESIYGDYEGCRIDFHDFQDWAAENMAWLCEYVDLVREDVSK